MSFWERNFCGGSCKFYDELGSLRRKEVGYKEKLLAISREHQQEMSEIMQTAKQLAEYADEMGQMVGKKVTDMVNQAIEDGQPPARVRAEVKKLMKRVQEEFPEFTKLAKSSIAFNKLLALGK